MSSDSENVSVELLLKIPLRQTLMIKNFSRFSAKDRYLGSKIPDKMIIRILGSPTSG
ncbi:hypothetical protein Lmac_2848 [Legionella maceachernii]|uniref:Uncharacterized protein n=1 Tax=Legionella maceachernii TaxID=466 RepID=A0A0W0VUT0_9GAMM|nr:hypothetical protein Lmac_2848 [Legionella maceachernii]SUP04411.1 Uncharacterised protein [Legionella maceachernii]